MMPKRHFDDFDDMMPKKHHRFDDDFCRDDDKKDFCDLVEGAIADEIGAVSHVCGHGRHGG